MQLHFPQCDPYHSFFEFYCDDLIVIQSSLNYGFGNKETQIQEQGVKFSEIFENIFPNENQEIYVIINSYFDFTTDYVLQQFENTERNFFRKEVFDPYLSKKREIVTLMIKRSECKYSTIITGILNDEFKLGPVIKDKIYFIDTANHVIFILWDGVVSVFSICAETLTTILKNLRNNISFNFEVRGSLSGFDLKD